MRPAAVSLVSTTAVFLLSAAAASLPVARGGFGDVSICGNYCGPGWCAGEYSPECSEEQGAGCKKRSSDCQEKGPTDGSCADACCRQHDKCCGSDDERQCNSNFYDCLWSCPSNDICTDGQGGVSPLLIWQGMELFAGDCCGHSCSGKDKTYYYSSSSCSWWDC